MKRPVLLATGLLSTLMCLVIVNSNPPVGIAMGVVGIVTLFLCGG